MNKQVTKLETFTPANCGTILTVDFHGKPMRIEALGSTLGFSTHPSNIICVYGFDKELHAAVELCISLDNNSDPVYNVFLFKPTNLIQHYKSYAYPRAGKKLPNKYDTLAEIARHSYKVIFG